MKIATWNVNSVKARLTRLLAFLEREQPDALCLQELKCEADKFPWDAVREAGYQAVALGQKTYNGVAILAKTPLIDVREGFGDESTDTQARCLSAMVDGVRVVNVYVPNGQEVGTEKYIYKLQWYERLLKYFGTYSRDEKLVLCGDFNVAPEDRDVYDPEAWRGKVLCSDLERAALTKICQWGLTDTFRKHHTKPGLYSWWDYRAGGFPRNLGLRIDFVLATALLAEVCVASRIDRDERKGELPSDHAPVISEFEL